MKSVRILLMVLALLAVLFPAVVLRSGVALADHDLVERTDFCQDTVVLFLSQVYAARGAGIAEKDILAVMDKSTAKDKAAAEWRDINRKLVTAVYADDVETVKKLNDAALAACIKYNYKATHPSKSA